MAKTMKEYMTKTRDGYGSGIARPKIDDKAHFELKGQFLKELHDNTFSDSDQEDANEHIEKEVILYYKGLEVPTRQILDSKGAIPTMTASNARAAVQEMAVYSQKWHDEKSTKTRTSNARAAVQEMAVYSQKWHDGTSTKTRSIETYDRLAAIQAQLNILEGKSRNKKTRINFNLIKEIRASTDAAIRNQGASIKALEIQIGQMSKILQEMGFGILPSSTKINPRDRVKSISTTVETDTTLIRRIGSTRYVVSAPQNTDLEASVSVMPFLTYTKLGLGELAPTKLIVELADRTVKCPKGIVENILVRIDKFVFLVDFIILDMPEDIKTLLILERPILSTDHSKIDVFKRKIILRVGNNKVVFKIDKPASNIIKRVYALSLREMMELYLEARLIGEALILNRSLDHLYEDYIELNDLNEPLELKRNQVDDLEPTIEKVENRCDNEIVDGLDEYPSYCDFDRKIHISCAFNLQFSCMIGYAYVNANFFHLLSINVISKRFYNSIMKEKVEYKGKNVVGAFMNVHIFVGKFSIVADFVVIKNMDAYRDDGMGDIIIGRPFCSKACVKTRRFDEMITVSKGNNSVTCQMARSHSRFKHITNAQCNKMQPLLKVSAQDDLKGISHPYQKLKGFYQEVLSLGSEYIKIEKVEEWLTHGHVSIHEME
nr:hypothetical protein [Tanacetum cinerariifolium]